MARRASILAAVFLFGAYALCAQAMLLREAQVILFGSELSWGLVLASWLAGVALGAQVGGWLSRRAWVAFAAAGLAMPLVLVLAVALLRLSRLMLDVGPGEYIGPGEMFLVSLAATMPVSLWVGLSFPAASALVAQDARAGADQARSVGWAYLVESAGGLVGGALYSFVLVERVGAITLALAGGAILATAVALAARGFGRGRHAVILPLGCAAMAAVFVMSGRAGRFDASTVRLRWQSFAAGHDLLHSEDTRYQNLAVGRLGDQFSLYADGLVAATWPNHQDLAIEAHLAACEARARNRILVLGGGAEGLLKELLRYKPDRLDYVTLDPRFVALAGPYLDDSDRRALAELGDRVHFTDIRRFVNHAAAARGEPYDLIILAAAEPASTLQARLYTEEFFEELASILSDNGVLAFALHGSVGYWGTAPANYVGSITLPLGRIFPRVLLTFGYPTRCYAAKREGVLAEGGDELARRYREAGVQSPYFDPLWFAGASDLMDPDKRAQVAEALESHRPALLNTDDHPAAALYHMRFWLQTSEAGHPGEAAPSQHRRDFIGMVLGLRFEWVLAAAAVATLLAAGAGAVRGRAGFRRTAALWSVATTGLATMALEIVLLYTFQTMYGYVYKMVGVVVGVFMFGLVLGSWAMNRRLRSGENGQRGQSPLSSPRPVGLTTLVWLDLAVMVFAASLVLALAALRSVAADWAVQAAIFSLVAVAGVLGGLLFPLAAAVMLEDRRTTGRAAGAVDAADNAGACLGAFVTGILLVPVLGVTGACLAVAGTKALSALLVGVAATVRPAASAPPSPAA
ncbi:MAG: fused MFS/spermidine synthase [Planctomycetes bacterium]|nr:fused MFS/spermidine synthase [Planctomycetota bacterium]